MAKEQSGDTVYVLHSRPYTDSKLIVELFSEQFGRISGVYRQPSKKRAYKPQPFTLYESQWFGGGELKTITVLDSVSAPVALSGESMFCGLYLNEILIRLIRKEDPCQTIFLAYQHAISCLSRSAVLEVPLRVFELQLLEGLGYGLDLRSDSEGEAIVNGKDYLFVSELGFVPVERVPERSKQDLLLSGSHLSAILMGQFDTPEIRRKAKLLCRSALSPLLGTKPLKSKELFT